jgi:hypothetical protein
VTRIFLGARFIRSASVLDSRLRTKAETALAQAARSFGDPHQHHGLGFRKLAPHTWECRIDLKWRIILIEEQDGLRAYEIMAMTKSAPG